MMGKLKAFSIAHNRSCSCLIEQTNDNDFILYEVDRPIEFNDKARPVFLPEKNDEGSATYVASGWGCLRSQDCKRLSAPDHADQLQAVRLQHVPREACQKSWGGDITERMLCAGEKDKKSTARWDSGGKTLIF